MESNLTKWNGVQLVDWEKDQAEVRKERTRWDAQEKTEKEDGDEWLRLGNIYDEVWDKGRDESNQRGHEGPDSRAGSTHFEVVHFCSEAKNTGSTPHGPFPLIVLLGIKPCVQKLEGKENKRRGPFSCIQEDRKVTLNLAFAKYQGKTSESRTYFAKSQITCRPGTKFGSSSKFCSHLGARNLNYYFLPSD